MKIRAREQILIAAVAGILILVLFVLFILRPQLSELARLGKEAQSKESEIKSAEATLARLEEYKKEMGRIERELAEIDKKMPKEPQLSSLIRDIQKIANESGIDFVSIKPSSLSQQPEYAEIPLEIVLDGYFGELVDFLYRLQNEMVREVKVTGLTITEGEKKLPNIKVTIKASAFVLQKGAAVSSQSVPSGTQQQSSGGTQSSSSTSSTSTGGTSTTSGTGGE